LSGGEQASKHTIVVPSTNLEVIAQMVELERLLYQLVLTGRILDFAGPPINNTSMSVLSVK